jgi:uncharacterized protein YbjQ (UPF0145 family)
MDKPFPSESSPFLTPYPPPGPAAAPGIKPFKAVDLVPPPGQSGPWLNALPQASPFLDRDPGKAAPAPWTPAAAPDPLSVPEKEAGLSHIFAAPQATDAPAVVPTAPKPILEAKVPAVAIAEPAIPHPSPAPMNTSAPRPGSATEIRAKATLVMTDADGPAEASRLAITTSPNLEGRPIKAYLGVVSVEIVIPKDILFRNPAPYGEMHRIRAAEEQLQSVKAKAFEELAERARALGANAVVGASLQFSQFDAVVFLCSAVGTAVKADL